MRATYHTGKTIRRWLGGDIVEKEDLGEKRSEDVEKGDVVESRGDEGDEAGSLRQALELRLVGDEEGSHVVDRRLPQENRPEPEHPELSQDRDEDQGQGHEEEE